MNNCDLNVGKKHATLILLKKKEVVSPEKEKKKKRKFKYFKILKLKIILAYI